MKKMNKNIARVFHKGFTLVELLIVIALLGALAIGLIGALDPFEQLKKGTDTGTRNTVTEVHQAIIRYYSLKGYMPWCADQNCTTFDPASISTGDTLVNIQTNVLSKIILTGELKSNFTTLQSSQLGKIYVTGTTGDAIVCYKPESKAFQADKNTKYTAFTGTADGTPATCKGSGATPGVDCWWCVQ